MSQCGKKNYCYKRYAYTNILRADICIVAEHFRRVHTKHSGNRNNRRDDGVQRNDPLRPAFLFDFPENALMRSQHYQSDVQNGKKQINGQNPHGKVTPEWRLVRNQVI